MGCETEPWQNSEVPKLPLLAIRAVQSPDRSGMLTPPIRSSASVPFHWEEKPGKPRFSFRNESTHKKSLELPPRMLLMEAKVPPPFKLLQGRPHVGRGRFQACSFHKEFCGSFRFEKKQLGAMVLRKSGVMEEEWLGWVGKAGFGGKRNAGSGCGSVFPSYCERENESGSFAVAESCSSRMKLAKIPRRGSYSCLAHVNTHFWGNIYEGLKQINLPWKTKKHEKQ